MLSLLKIIILFTEGFLCTMFYIKGFIYILKRWLKTSKIIISHPTYSSLGAWMAKAYPHSSGCQAGTHPGQDFLPPQGHTHTHPDWDYLDTPIHVTAHLWDVDGYRSSPSKPTQTRGKRANHTDSGPGRNPFFSPPINIITKHYRRKYYRYQEPMKICA